MLYSESPIGVGFSYSTVTSSYVGVNDKITGKSLASILLFHFISWSQLTFFLPFSFLASHVSLSSFYFSCYLYLLLNPVLSLVPKVFLNIMLFHYLLFLLYC